MKKLLAIILSLLMLLPTIALPSFVSAAETITTVNIDEDFADIDMTDAVDGIIKLTKDSAITEFYAKENGETYRTWKITRQGSYRRGWFGAIDSTYATASGNSQVTYTFDNNALFFHSTGDNREFPKNYISADLDNPIVKNGKTTVSFSYAFGTKDHPSGIAMDIGGICFTINGGDGNNWFYTDTTLTNKVKTSVALSPITLYDISIEFDWATNTYKLLYAARGGEKTPVATGTLTPNADSDANKIIIYSCHNDWTYSAIVDDIVVKTEEAPVIETQASYLPRINMHLLGDSTVADYNTTYNTTLVGWGQALEARLDSRVIVRNWAISGATTKSFLEGYLKSDGATYDYGPQWPTIKKNIKPGDYVFIQFGHNDQNPASGEHVNVVVDKDTYVNNLKTMVKEAKDLGAIPVLVTPPVQKDYDETQHSGNKFNQYARAMYDMAAAEGYTCIDLNSSSKAFWENIEMENRHEYFEADLTVHFTQKGALEMANLIVTDSKFPEALKPYVLSKDAAAGNIFRPTLNNYFKENFDAATLEAGKTTALKNSSLAINGTRTNSTDLEVATESNGNRFLQYTKASEQQYSNAQINIQTATTAVQAKVSVLDFSIWMPGYEEYGRTNAFELDWIARPNAAWAKITSMIFETDSSNKINIKYINGDDSNGSSRELKFTNIYSGAEMSENTEGNWFPVRFIFDEYNSQFSVIFNGRLLATDIPYINDISTDTGFRAMQFRVRVAHGNATEHTFGLDDIYFYPVSERKAAQMLLQAADKNIESIGMLVPSMTVNDGDALKFKLPTTVGLDSAKSCLTWGDSLTYGADVSNMWFGWNVKNQEGAASTMLNPYREAKLWAPPGYSTHANVGEGSYTAQLKATVKFGNYSVVDYLQTLNVQRRLLETLDPTIEIGLPKFLNILKYKADLSNIQEVAVSTGTDGGKLNGTVADTPDGLGWYSQTIIKNTGTEDRRIILAQVIYGADGTLERLMNTQVVYTVPANGGYVKFTPNGINAENYDTLPDNAVIKMLFMDADTMKPLTKALEIERNYVPAS